MFSWHKYLVSQQQKKLWLSFSVLFNYRSRPWRANILITTKDNVNSRVFVRKIQLVFSLSITIISLSLMSSTSCCRSGIEIIIARIIICIYRILTCWTILVIKYFQPFLPIFLSIFTNQLLTFKITAPKALRLGLIARRGVPLTRRLTKRLIHAE